MKVQPPTVLYATGQPTTDRLPTAKEIFQAQYARGEIIREQYEFRKLDIG